MKSVRTVLFFAALGLAACSKPSTGEQAVAKTDDSAKLAPKASASVATKASASASGSADKTAIPMPSGSAPEPYFTKRKATGLGANEAEVAGYPDEKKLEPAAKKKLAAAYYTVRVEANGSGKSVAVLTKDAEVTVVAERGKHLLVTFANPDKSTETLVGWILKIAFDAPSLAGCPSAGLMVDSPTSGVFCAKPCTPDKACPAGQKCNHGACMPSGD